MLSFFRFNKDMEHFNFTLELCILLENASSKKLADMFVLFALAARNVSIYM
jgi:hypothetical protein